MVVTGWIQPQVRDSQEPLFSHETAWANLPHQWCLGSSVWDTDPRRGLQCVTKSMGSEVREARI